MQKITVTFIYTKDETRKLRYRLSSETTIGEMIAKLIKFQFVIDCEDYNTFEVSVGGNRITSLSDTFETCGIKDGDEIFITPTVFRPVPPPQNNNNSQNHQGRRRPPRQSRPSQSKRPDQGAQSKQSAAQKPPRDVAPATDSIRTDATGAPIAFKPQPKGYKRGYNNRRRNNNMRPRPQGQNTSGAQGNTLPSKTE